MKIGLFGGSFNPVHSSHINIVKQVLDDGIAEEVWFVPCGNHAFNKNLEGAEHRVKMIERAIKGINKIKINDIEIKSSGINYTIDTVRKLRKIYPEHEFFLIIGADIICEITKWHKYKELLEEIDMFIFKRSMKDISSTQIREKLKNGESIKGLVSEEVEKYILENNLYN